VQGGAYDKNNVLKYKLTGTWNDRLLAIPIGEDNSEGEPIELWKVTPLPPHADRQYYFTKVCEFTDFSFTKPSLTVKNRSLPCN